MKPKDVNGDIPVVQLDKWLWASRFYKTRALTRETIEGGKFITMDKCSKPGKTIGGARRSRCVKAIINVK